MDAERLPDEAPYRPGRSYPRLEILEFSGLYGGRARLTSPAGTPA
jgi:hypothetical protein